MAKYDRLKEVLDHLGVNPNSWEAEHTLKERVEAQSKVFDPEFIDKIRKAKWALDTALQAAEEIELAQVPLEATA